MKKRTRIILSVCLAVLLLFGIGGYAYVSDYYHADETALEAMRSIPELPTTARFVSTILSTRYRKSVGSAETKLGM